MPSNPASSSIEAIATPSVAFMKAVPLQNCIRHPSVSNAPCFFSGKFGQHQEDAAETDGEVLACYVLDPRLKASSGPRRLQYLYDALRELRDALDGRLIVTRGQPEKRIPPLAKAVGASAVHVSA